MSCNAYVCVLVCARSVLGSVLRFTVFVQQAIAEITLEVLFEIRRHQHIGTSTNLHENDITNTSLFLVLFNYSLIFFRFLWLHMYLFIVLQFSFFLSFLCCPISAVLHLFSALFTSPSLPLCPTPLSSFLAASYHSKEAQQPQSLGTSAAGLVVHKQAFHTTAKCVGMVSLVKPSQTCRVVKIFISDTQNESTTTSVKL